jgi:2-phosphosulfolactate phosphatase
VPERPVEIVGLDAEVTAGAVVVVIDVIRAFTTAAVAFDRGATDILCTPTASSARDLKGAHPDRLLIGEERGLKPEDFDFDNSPFEMSEACLGGRGLIQATSNGTRGLVRVTGAAALLAASAANVSATAQWIDRHRPGAACFIVCTGRTAEDWACARHLRKLIGGREPSGDDLLAGLALGASEHTRAYEDRPGPDRLGLARDLEFCRDVDRFAFAMVAERYNDHAALLTREGVTGRP